MFRPKIPTMPVPTGQVTPAVFVEPTTVTTSAHAVPPTAPTQTRRPVVQLTPGTALALIGGGTAAVLVVGAVLVSMLLAVAVTGASIAVCALVVRSLISAETRRR
ncbi:SpdD-like protein [Streptomyces sp. NPDC003635]